MRQVNLSETSMMKSDGSEALAAFATLRFVGDRLDPGTLSRIVGTSPTLAYRKGEIYHPDRRSSPAIAPTGMWYLSTRRLLASHDPIAHLRYLLALLPPDRLNALRALLRQNGVEASVSCFWHGRSGARAPTIPPDIAAVFHSLPAEIETDFATD
jgi:hypothetical protein